MFWSGDLRRPSSVVSDMTEYVQVWRAKVPADAVGPLLAIRPAAIEEATRLCPEL